MVDPRNGAGVVIRDTGADAGRFLWSVLAAGDMDPMSEGRTEDLGQAQSIGEAALRAYAENRPADIRPFLRNVKIRSVISTAGPPVLRLSAKGHPASPGQSG
jgi:hypothetical protein